MWKMLAWTRCWFLMHQVINKAWKCLFFVYFICFHVCILACKKLKLNSRLFKTGVGTLGYLLTHPAECCHLVVESKQNELTDDTCGSWISGKQWSTSCPGVCSALQPPKNCGQTGWRKVCSMPEFLVLLLGTWRNTDSVYHHITTL